VSDTALDDFVQALDHLPSGTVTGHFQNRRYVTTKSIFNDGKSVKLVAEELGGRDYVSLNLYLLGSGPRLYPCEMSTAKVQAFVLGFHPEHAHDQDDA